MGKEKCDFISTYMYVGVYIKSSCTLHLVILPGYWYKIICPQMEGQQGPVSAQRRYKLPDWLAVLNDMLEFEVHVHVYMIVAIMCGTYS